jgi:hypothetical protein
LREELVEDAAQSVHHILLVRDAVLEEEVAHRREIRAPPQHRIDEVPCQDGFSTSRVCGNPEHLRLLAVSPLAKEPVSHEPNARPRHRGRVDVFSVEVWYCIEIPL